MPKRVLKTKKVSTAVLEEIRRMILSGELVEGDKLPNQNEFAAQLGVSRPSLREALQVLSQMGAIEQRPGAGTILVARAPALFDTQVDLPLISDNYASVELMEARRMVEVGLAALAAKRATDEDVADLERALRGMDRARKGPDHKVFVENDLVFHHLMAKASHNRFAISLFQSLTQAFMQLLDDSLRAMPEMLDVAYQAHDEIFQAIRQRDPAAATKAISKHIRDGEKALANYNRDHEAED